MIGELEKRVQIKERKRKDDEKIEVKINKGQNKGKTIA
jgi:hypothetical protein